MSDGDFGEKKIDVFPQLPITPTAPKPNAGLIVAAVLMFIFGAYRVVDLVYSLILGAGATNILMSLVWTVACIYLGYSILKCRKSAFSGTLVLNILLIVVNVAFIFALDVGEAAWIILAPMALLVAVIILVCINRKYLVTLDPRRGQRQPPVPPVQQ